MTISASTRVSTLPVSPQLFSRRDQIPHRQDVLWRIERGVVRTVTWSESGTIIVLGCWGPGDIIGHLLGSNAILWGETQKSMAYAATA